MFGSRLGGQHLECVMSHSPGVTFRGNTFRNCGVFDISLGRGDWWGQPQYGNVTIENNVFGHTVDGGAGGDWHYYGLAWWLTTLDGARVVNNTFENAVSMDRATRGIRRGVGEQHRRRLELRPRRDLCRQRREGLQWAGQGRQPVVLGAQPGRPDGLGEPGRL